MRACAKYGEGQAREDATPVDMHRARAALAVIAAFLCPCKPDVLAQGVEKRNAGLFVRFLGVLRLGSCPTCSSGGAITPCL